MIIRLTQKLAKKIHATDALNTLELDKNPYLDWTANLFRVGHTQYIIFTNTVSLFSFVMYGRGIADSDSFIKDFHFFLESYLLDSGNEKIYEEQIETDNSPIMFARPNDRSVLGSMNQLVKDIQFEMEIHDLTIDEMTDRILETPMSKLKYSYPKEIFPKMKTAKQD